MEGGSTNKHLDDKEGEWEIEPAEEVKQRACKDSAAVALHLLVVRKHGLIEEGDGDADSAVCSGGEKALKLRAEHCLCY